MSDIKLDNRHICLDNIYNCPLQIVRIWNRRFYYFVYEIIRAIMEMSNVTLLVVDAFFQTFTLSHLPSSVATLSFHFREFNSLLLAKKILSLSLLLSLKT